MQNSEFYNTLADNYDDMINFENSLKNKIESFQNFISPNYKRVLDLGCGTGTDSIALSKLGFKVDAVDHSKGMLEKAAKNAKKYLVNINFSQSNLGELSLDNKCYDLIVSLGNTIANIESDELESLLQAIIDHINPKGKIVIQLINYAKFPATGTHILNEFKNDTLSIIRKYEFHQHYINFIITKEDITTGEYTNIITKLFPHSSKTFIKFAKEYELSIELFGSLNKEPYIENKSQNLVIILSKQK